MKKYTLVCLAMAALALSACGKKETGTTKKTSNSCDTINAKKCNSDQSAVEYCSTANVWVVDETCVTGNVCAAAGPGNYACVPTNSNNTTTAPGSLEEFFICEADVDCAGDRPCRQHAVFGKICVTDCSASQAACGNDQYCDVLSFAPNQSSCFRASARNELCFNEDGCADPSLTCQFLSPVNNTCKKGCSVAEVGNTTICGTAGEICMMSGGFDFQRESNGSLTPCLGNPSACAANYECIIEGENSGCIQYLAACGTAATMITDVSSVGLTAFLTGVTTDPATTKLCDRPRFEDYCAPLTDGNAPVECAMVNSTGYSVIRDGGNIDCNPQARQGDLDYGLCAGSGGECLTFGTSSVCGFLAKGCAAFCDDDNFSPIPGVTCPANQTCKEAEGSIGNYQLEGGATELSAAPTCTGLTDTTTCDSTGGFSCKNFGNSTSADWRCGKYRRVCAL